MHMSEICPNFGMHLKYSRLLSHFSVSIASTALKLNHQLQLFNPQLGWNFSLLTRPWPRYAVLCCVAPFFSSLPRFRKNVGHPSDLLAHSKHCVLLGRAGCQLPMVDNAATPSIGSYAFKYLGHKQNPESKGRFSDWFSCLVAPCIILGPRVNQYMTEIGENQMLHLIQTWIPDIFEDLHFLVTPWWYDLLSNLTMKRTLINNFHISISVGHRKLLKQLFKYQKQLRYVKICWSP